MFSSAPWMLTALAVVLAVVAAGCFAGGAVLQQRAVARALPHPDVVVARRIGVDRGSFRRLARQPRWLIGGALIGAGALLHLSALLLAPVSVVQPIGILAVPVAVLLAARAAGTRPAAGVVSGVALSVAGTGAFVLLASRGTAPGSPGATLARVLTALALTAAVVAGLDVLARRRGDVTRCLAYAAMGAVSFGFGSALVATISQQVSTSLANLGSPVVLTAGLALLGALTLGAWAVQQAYAAGPAEVVLSTLTVGDPVVAIGLSAGLLGEPLHVGPAAVAVMVACSVVAAAGVRLLAAHHPAVPSPTLPAVPASQAERARDLVAVG